MKYFLTFTLLLFFTVKLQAQTPKTSETSKTKSVQEAQSVIQYLKNAEQEHQGHQHSKIPTETQLANLEINQKKVIFYLEMPIDFLENEYDELLFEELGLRLFNVMPQPLNLNQFEVKVKNNKGKYVPLSDFGTYLKDEPYQYENNDIGDGGAKIRLSDDPDLQRNPGIGQGQPQGNLTGKTVWLSPGHGWLYYTSQNGYTTQRGETNDMVEDFGTIEGINYYLLKYLWNAGANIWSVRERDVNEK